MAPSRFMRHFLRSYVHHMHSEYSAIFEVMSKASGTHNNLRQQQPLWQIRCSATLRSRTKSREGYDLNSSESRLRTEHDAHNDSQASAKTQGP